MRESGRKAEELGRSAAEEDREMTPATITGSETPTAAGESTGPPSPAASCPPNEFRREAWAPDDYGAFAHERDPSQEFIKYTCKRCGHSEHRQEYR